MYGEEMWVCICALNPKTPGTPRRWQSKGFSQTTCKSKVGIFTSVTHVALTNKKKMQTLLERQAKEIILKSRAHGSHLVSTVKQCSGFQLSESCRLKQAPFHPASRQGSKTNAFYGGASHESAPLEPRCQVTRKRTFMRDSALH